jgi:hypothetical protein
MSGGSNDDATLGIAHRDKDGCLFLDRIVDQGQRPPFDPRKAVERFANVLKEYGLRSVVGDQYAGETFRADSTTMRTGRPGRLIWRARIKSSTRVPFRSASGVASAQKSGKRVLAAMIAARSTDRQG